ncbi:MAG: 3-phosphoglycerate dehydrogenase [Bacteroidales bacterium]|nr:3-phosphoglycerate dehydrogenase [Bacteroidales bacterium]
MNNILIATDKPFAPVAVQGIKEIAEKGGCQLSLLEKYTDKSQLLAAVKDANAIIIRSDIIDKEVLAAAPNLKIVVRAGAGYDNVDLDAATQHGVVVMNTPGQNANAVAELAFGLMLMLARAGFSGKAGTELRSKTLGIHAYGNIGKLVNKIAQGFGMKVYAYDPFVDKFVIEADGITPVGSADELYEKSQYVSLHLPANSATKNSINLALLSKMPKGAALINTARKEVIDEAGLLKAFENRPDFMYASDIEPACKAEIEERFKGRCFLTPKKMGAQTEEANINAGLAAANQIVKFFQTGDKTFQVNK